MESFGKYLARVGAVSREQLEAATEALVIVGGRLGTNLVDLGFMSVAEVDGRLADFLGVPRPRPEWLDAPSSAALAAVPAPLLARFPVLPLAVADGVLHLAMSDPGRPDTVDEVRFASGLAVQPYVLSEAHLAWLRERHLGLLRPRRFVSLPSLEAPATAPADRRQPEPCPAEAEALRFREAHGLHPMDSKELIDPETFSSLLDHWKPGGSAPVHAGSSPELELELRTLAEPEDAIACADPVREDAPVGPAELAELEAQLACVSDREELTRCSLRLARAHASVAALFLVHRGNIQGFRASGGQLGERIGGVFLPLSAPSVFAAVATRGWAYRGRPPRGGIDAPLMRMLGRNESRDVAILPVHAGGRVLNLLYADNGSAGLANTSIAALVTVSGCIGKAYERLLLARRQKHC